MVAATPGRGGGSSSDMLRPRAAMIVRISIWRAPLRGESVIFKIYLRIDTRMTRALASGFPGSAPDAVIFETQPPHAHGIVQVAPVHHHGTPHQLAHPRHVEAAEHAPLRHQH